MPTLRICLLSSVAALCACAAMAGLPVSTAVTSAVSAMTCGCGHSHAGPCPLRYDPSGAETGSDWNDSQASGSDPGVAEFRIRNGWTRTTGTTFRGRGDPVTLTWGFVADGLSISGGVGEPRSDSDLIAFLDGNVGNGRDVQGRNGTNQSGKSWFRLFESSYERWESLSGVTFDYEANDNSASFPNSAGSTGLRADMRIAGHFVDGQDGPNTLAYNYFPNFGDMVIDTSNVSFYSSRNNDFRALRNTVMHEVGHGLGLNHVESNNSGQLMEPRINLGFDGPQIDDIIAIQRNYGDAWEKDGGNDTTRTATDAGSLALFTPWTVGADGDFTNRSTRVTMDQTDFISIDDRSDTDVFRFTPRGAGLLDLRLKPVGPTYNEAAQAPSGSDPFPQNPLDLAAQSRLTISILNGAGVQVATRQAAARGETLVVPDIPVEPGETYYAQVGSLEFNPQLYRLDAALNPQPNEGIDFDLDSLQITGQSTVTTTVDGIELTLAASGRGATLAQADEGIGVLSGNESGRDPNSLNINGDFVTPEQLLLSFDKAVFLENLEIRSLDVEEDEEVFLTLVAGPNPFEHLRGYTGAYSRLPGAEGLAFTSLGWQSELINMAFGVAGQDRLMVHAGTVLALTSRGAEGGGIALSGLTVTLVPEPVALLLVTVGAAMTPVFRGRRSAGGW